MNRARLREVAASAPGRVNLLGEHTDYNDGFVLPTALPQRTTVHVSLSPDDRHHAHSDAIGEVHEFGLDDPLHGFARYVGGCLRVLRDTGRVTPPLRFSIESEVPVGAGLSSSAALEVAVLRAVDALLGLDLDPVEIARLAQRAEIHHAGVACGIMDQMACSLAQEGTALFLDTRSLERRLIELPTQTELVVVHSGVPRRLSDSAYNERRSECAAACAALGVTSLRDVNEVAQLSALPPLLQRRARHVVTENARVLAALTADATGFGEAMNQSHASLRDDYQVSVPALDELAARLRAQPGSYGARLTGAGFGGCCVALVERGAATRIADAVAASPGFGGSIIVPDRR